MDHLIPVDKFFTIYKVDRSFLYSLQEFGLMEIISVEESKFIHVSDLPQLEKVINLNYELDINIAGIEAITHLLSRIADMQNKITILENRLRFYGSIE